MLTHSSTCRTAQSSRRMLRAIKPSRRHDQLLETLESRLLLTTDVLFAALQKDISYEQTSSGTATVQSTGGYSDGALVVGNPAQPHNITSASAGSINNPSNSGPLTYKSAEDKYDDNTSFDTKAALDANAPPGAGVFVAMTTVHDGAHQFNFTIPSDNYPAAPHITDFSALASADPSQPLTITWDPQSNGTANDFQMVRVDDNSGNKIFQTPMPYTAGVLTGQATQYTIPAGTLTANQTYSISLTFIKVAQNNTTTYPGAHGLLVFIADTSANLATGTPAPTVVSTTTTLQVPASSAQPNTPVDLVVTVAETSGSATPTGTVTLRDGVSVVGTQTLANGTTTFTSSTFVSGSHAFTAFYSGDATNQASSSDTQHFTILPGTLTFPSSGKVIVTGPDAGSVPLIKIFDATNGNLTSQFLAYQFLAYDSAFPGAVRVASGDVNGDGFPDVVTATGPGGQPLVNVFDGKTGTLIANFYAYVPAYIGGVEITVANILGLSSPQIITSTDAGGQPLVNIYNYTGTLLKNFYAYSPDYIGGVRIAATPAHGAIPAMILTATAAGGVPLVNVFNSDTGTLVSNFYGAALSYTNGFHIATGDANGDGVPDIIIANDAGSVPEVRVYDGATRVLLNTFDAYALSFTGGVRVAAVATTSSGKADVITAPGPGGAPQINVFNALSGSQINTFAAYDSSVTNGLFISAGQTST